MENNFYFKSLEVTGTTKEEAFANTPFTAPVTTWTNATQKWQNFLKKNPAPTQAEIKQFELDYAKEKKLAPGQAAYIVKEAGVADSRERPYKVENVKHEGTRKNTGIHVAYNLATDEKLCNLAAKKADSIDMVKKMIASGKYRCDIKIDKERVYDDPTVAIVRYTPSKNRKVGTYRVFGFATID